MALTQAGIFAGLPPQTTADVWTYRFYQMQNGLPGYTSEIHLFDLPVNQVTFGTKLGQVGQLQGTVQSSDATVQGVLAGQPPWHMLCDRTAVYVDLNGSLVWGGVLQQVQYQRTNHQVQITAQDWWGYFAQERIVSLNLSYAAVDQLLIAADIINIAQGAASSASQSPTIGAGFVVGGNVGVSLGVLAAAALAGTYTSGVDVTVAYAQSAFKNAGQAISDLGGSSQGFDWTIDCYYVNGVPTKAFNLWYPRAGRTQQQQLTSGATVTFDMGSTSGVDYIWSTGQTQPANIVFGAGSGAGNTAIASEAANPALLQAGWPVMEDSQSWTDVNDQGLLNGLTLAYLNQVQYPVSFPELYYACGNDSNLPLGSYAIGDDARLIIDPDDYFLTGYDSARATASIGEQWWRIIQWTVNVADDGKSYNDIVFGPPPIFPA